jgi:type IV secretory pathway component VirB8
MGYNMNQHCYYLLEVFKYFQDNIANDDEIFTYKYERYEERGVNINIIYNIHKKLEDGVTLIMPQSKLINIKEIVK